MEILSHFQEVEELQFMQIAGRVALLAKEPEQVASITEGIPFLIGIEKIYRRKAKNMHLNREYNNYYVYSSVYQNGTLVSSGACPVIWQDNVVLQGNMWRKGLTWADGNYHLYENSSLTTEDAQFVEECIYTNMNEAEERIGKVSIDDSNHLVRWCILEKEQIDIVMDLFD